MQISLNWLHSANQNKPGFSTNTDMHMRNIRQMNPNLNRHKLRLALGQHDGWWIIFSQREVQRWVKRMKEKRKNAGKLRSWKNGLLNEGKWDDHRVHTDTEGNGSMKSWHNLGYDMQHLDWGAYQIGTTLVWKINKCWQESDFPNVRVSF